MKADDTANSRRYTLGDDPQKELKNPFCDVNNTKTDTKTATTQLNTQTTGQHVLYDSQESKLPTLSDNQFLCDGCLFFVFRRPCNVDRILASCSWRMDDHISNSCNSNAHWKCGSCKHHKHVLLLSSRKCLFYSPRESVCFTLFGYVNVYPFWLYICVTCTVSIYYQPNTP